jgi:GH24 family phage-related lysozyme (muramidase)
VDLAKVKALITLHEGLKAFPYVDTVGKITIGVGHNLTDKGLSAKQIDFILGDDIVDTLVFLASHCPWFAALDEVRQRAIIDLTFDIQGKLLGFKNMITALEGSEWNVASTELLNSTFARQTGKRATDLAHMILTGTDL